MQINTSWQKVRVFWSTYSDLACTLWVFPGEGDATNARFQRRPDADAHHGAVYGRPPAVAMETAGHRHDGQVSAALGRAR